MRVRELMTANPATCTPDSSLHDVARMMVGYDCGEIPVVDGRDTLRPVGVVTDRDITCRAVAAGKNPLELTAADCMSTPCVTIDPNASLSDCCRVLEENRVRRVVVVDDQGRCCGIVSQADIALYASERKTAEVLKEVSQPAGDHKPAAQVGPAQSAHS